MDELIQKRLLANNIHLKFVDDKRIQVSAKSWSGKSEEIYNLFDLNENYDAYQFRPLKMLVFGIPLLAAGILALVTGFSDYPDQLLQSLGVLLTILGSGCLLGYFAKSIDVLCFRSRHNGQVLFSMLATKPNRNIAQAFADQLVERIKNTKFHPDASPAEKLNAYKDALEFLVAEEVVSVEEAQAFFDRARDMLTENKVALFDVNAKK